MTENEVLIRKQLGFLHPELLADLLEHATVMDVPEHVEILRYGQYVKVVPIVLSGLVKVFTRYDEKELLLYYIQPNESCVMSFSAALENAPSEVFAVTEEASKLLVIPNDHLKQWTQAYPAFNRLFFSLYNARYNDLIETINHLLYQKLDVRVLQFLHERSAVTGQGAVRMSHRQIASELGTAREVVTRVLKKLESDGKLKQTDSGIVLL